MPVARVGSGVNHRHILGVPQVIVYDRTKTVVKRHVGRGQTPC